MLAVDWEHVLRGNEPSNWKLVLLINGWMLGEPLGDWWGGGTIGVRRRVCMFVCVCEEEPLGDRWGGGTIGVKRRVCTCVCMCEEKKGYESRGLLT